MKTFKLLKQFLLFFAIIFSMSFIKSPDKHPLSCVAVLNVVNNSDATIGRVSIQGHDANSCPIDYSYANRIVPNGTYTAPMPCVGGTGGGLGIYVVSGSVTTRSPIQGSIQLYDKSGTLLYNSGFSPGLSGYFSFSYTSPFECNGVKLQFTGY